MADAATHIVSVILVNYKGAEHTIACLKAFDDVDWPAGQLELIVVENASNDGSADRIRAAVPNAKVVESPTNSGFAGGCNLGVANATGEYVAFINNDAKPHRNWIRAAVDVLDRDHSIACVASKVLDWDGANIDYVDGSLTWYGMGYKREVERPDSPDYDHPKDVLFATGAAMFVRTEVYRSVGGFDERFFMFYEDVDFGWRLNLLGHRVRYVPGSVAYHRHHVTIKQFGQYRETYLLERNALMSMYKNYSDETLAKVLPAAMALSVRRSLARGQDDASALDLQRSVGGDGDEKLEVSKQTLTGPYAIDYFVQNLRSLREDRERLQQERKRSDPELMPLFRQAMEPAYGEPSYLEGYQALVDAFDIEEAFSQRRRIVVVTGEPLGVKMAGPAIRAFEIAKALSAEHDVVLATMGRCAIESKHFECKSVSSRDLRNLENWADVIIFQGLLLSIHPWLRRSRKILVADIYDPFHLEVLEQERDKSEAARNHTLSECISALNVQLKRGDFFLCASPKQRDLWMGQLAGLGRVNPATYDSDETLERLIGVVPFGISDTPPVHNRPVVKGVVDGIGPDDSLILWGGGIYNWFDPLTLIRAIDRLRHRRPDVRLFFLGLKHPNPDVPEMRMSVRARDLSDQLGLTNKFVFFNEGWVTYSERQNYLLEADIGVSCHLDHVETAYSFRTRILDYLWSGLPIVTTDGDSFGDLVTKEGLGVAVPAEDIGALEDALFKLLDDAEFRARCRKHVDEVSVSFTWPNVLQPLLNFCRTPRRAPDLVDENAFLDIAAPTAFTDRYRPTMRENLAVARKYMREGGIREVGVRAWGRVRRRAGELTRGR